LAADTRFCPNDGTPLSDTAATAPTSARTPTGRPQSALHLELPVVLGARYRLEELRGGGGMAKVYRAIDLTLEREVAVKLINPELRTEPEFDARFQREARIPSQLADPHIIVVHDFGLDTNYGPYLVMEFLKGQSLRERLQAQGPLPVKAAIQVSAQLLLALIHAHDKGIVHRDLKPDNIFLLNVSGVRLHVRVLDFGIARIYRRDDPARSETLTRPGAVLGTPRYMSPEQLAGQPVDARSDLYSAAMVIHEALTGQLPYIGGSLAELCPGVPAALIDLLDHCLRPNPKDRPACAVEVYMRLLDLGKASGVLLLPPGAMEKLIASRQTQEPTVAYVEPKPSPKGPARRNRLLWIGVAVLAVAALGGVGGFLVWPPHGTSRPDRESVLGLKIGASRDDVIAELGKPQQEVEPGQPLTAAVKEALGHVLAHTAAGTPGALAQVNVLLWSEKNVCVLLGQSGVRGVVVRGPHPAVSGRGVRIGDTAQRLEERYAEEPEMSTFHERPAAGGSPPPAAKWGKIYLYHALGIGFEVQDGKLTAMTLYPPRPKEGS
jgi:tRNA A-37 threonylcarbamoyl transferase component Bud32